MLLAFDIGNTNIVIGVFQQDKLLADWRVASDRQKTFDEYGLLLEQFFQSRHLQRKDVTDISPFSFTTQKVVAVPKSKIINGVPYCSMAATALTIRSAHVIGRNTSNAIQSGLLYGYCGLVDGMVHRIADALHTPTAQMQRHLRTFPTVYQNAAAIFPQHEVHCHDVAELGYQFQLGNLQVQALPVEHRVSCLAYSLSLPRAGKFDVAKAQKSLSIFPVKFRNT